MSSKCTLLSLSNELLLQIAGHLSSDHHEDLLNLLLTNRRLYSLLYYDFITIAISHFEALDDFDISNKFCPACCSTVLTWAVKQGNNNDYIRVLLLRLREADDGLSRLCNVCDATMLESALYCAICVENAAAVKMLVNEFGAPLEKMLKKVFGKDFFRREHSWRWMHGSSGSAMLQTFISVGMDLNIRFYGNAVLHLLCRLLYEQEYDVREGESPQLLKDQVRIWLEAGASPDVLDLEGRTALENLLSHYFEGCRYFRYLKNLDKEPTPIVDRLKSIQQEHVCDMVKLLLDFGAEAGTLHFEAERARRLGEIELARILEEAVARHEAEDVLPSWFTQL